MKFLFCLLSLLAVEFIHWRFNLLQHCTQVWTAKQHCGCTVAQDDQIRIGCWRKILVSMNRSLSTHPISVKLPDIFRQLITWAKLIANSIWNKHHITPRLSVWFLQHQEGRLQSQYQEYPTNETSLKVLPDLLQRCLIRAEMISTSH